jgi:hypothetical protein
MAIRLEAERFLEYVLKKNGRETGCSHDQTRAWSQKAVRHLTPSAQKIVNNVVLMTPEEIHVNAFMYEPIIDMSDWALKELFKRVRQLADSPDSGMA